MVKRLLAGSSAGHRHAGAVEGDAVAQADVVEVAGGASTVSRLPKRAPARGFADGLPRSWTAAMRPTPVMIPVNIRLFSQSMAPSLAAGRANASAPR